MAEPATRHTDEDGGKYYLHPFRTEPDGSPRRYTSVTTALSIMDKRALKFWSAKGSARRAMENLPKLVAAARIDPCLNTWKRDNSRCNECYECHVRWVEMWHIGKAEDRRREGSAIHDVIEHWTYHGDVPGFDPVIEPYVAQFLKWVEDYGLKPESWQACEMTVYNHTHLFAGTLDGIVQFEPVTAKAAKLCARIRHAQKLHPDGPAVVVWDGKSREGEGKALYDEHPLQLAPYRWAESALVKGINQEVDMPPTMGGVIFQPRPDGYTCEPVVTDAATFEAFLNLLKLYRWHAEFGPASIRVDSFPTPEGFKWTGQPSPDVEGTPVGAVKPRKATKRAASKAAPGPTGSATLRSMQRIDAAPLDTVLTTGRYGREDNIPF